MQVRFLVSPTRIQEKNGWGMRVLIGVEAVPAGSKQPAVVRVRISAGETHDLIPQRRCLPGHYPLNKGRAGGPVEY